MISSSGLPINLQPLKDPLAGEAAAGKGGADFLAALQQQGKGPLTPQALMALLVMPQAGGKKLEGEVPVEGLPEELPELPDEIVAADPAALLALMAAGRESGALPQQQGQALAAAAQQAAQDKALFGQLQASAESVAEAPFDAALQAVTKPDVTTGRVQVPEFTISTPVQQPGWGQAVGERLVWSVREGLQQANIRLDPPHLGPLELSINVKDDHTTVVIQAHHATTREALEAEMPRLRAMLADAGFGSVDVNVSQQQRERHGAGQPGSAGGSAAAAGETDGAEVQQIELGTVGRGLVDHYA